jgi:hypothetical protein
MPLSTSTREWLHPGIYPHKKSLNTEIPDFEDFIYKPSVILVNKSNW